MIKNKKDFILGVVSIAISVWIISMTIALPSAQYSGDPGPKMFPMIGGVLLAVCGVLMVIRQDAPSSKVFLTKEQWKETLTFFAVYLASVALMWVFGWTISTPIILFMFTFLLSKISMSDASIKKRIITSLIWAVLCGAGIYLAYKVGLKARLPKGLLKLL